MICRKSAPGHRAPCIELKSGDIMRSNAVSQNALSSGKPPSASMLGKAAIITVRAKIEHLTPPVPTTRNSVNRHWSERDYRYSKKNSFAKNEAALARQNRANFWRTDWSRLYLRISRLPGAITGVRSQSVPDSGFNRCRTFMPMAPPVFWAYTRPLTPDESDIRNLSVARGYSSASMRVSRRLRINREPQKNGQPSSSLLFNSCKIRRPSVFVRKSFDNASAPDEGRRRNQSARGCETRFFRAV